MAEPRATEVRRKYAAIRQGIEEGRFYGELRGPPVIGPLLGSVKGYCTTVWRLFREDLRAPKHS